MKTILRFTSCLFFFCFLLPDAPAQIVRPAPAKIGYAYPAGGQRGTTFEMIVVGRANLRSVRAVFSGDGVSATVLDTMFAFRNLDQRDRYMIRKRIGDVARQAHEQMKPDTEEFKRMKELIDRLPKINRPPDPPEEIAAVPFVWPRNYIWRKISEPDVRLPLDEVLELIYLSYGPGMWRRPPDPLMDVVVLEVTIAPDAEPGDRELRLVTNTGVTNPLYFQVGIHPEAMEREPNSPDNHGLSRLLGAFEKPVYRTPIVLNGQITHADVDRFCFHARKNQQLVLQVQARQLMPYLADAVPGWFEAVVTVYDAKENELCYADCRHFDPDPVLVFSVPEDGVYIAEVRDSLFRGREDFVYRLTIAETPVVESVFPLGLREGESQTFRLTGVNLPVDELRIERAEPGVPIREVTRLGDAWLPIPFHYEVETLPEIIGAEGNHAPAFSQPISLPSIVNGRIAKPGEYDFYCFDAKAGESVTIEVMARRVDSLLDSRITLFAPDGTIVAENDDGKTVDKKYLSALIGTRTHNADSKLTSTLSVDGTYVVRIGDATRQGGDAYGYRLKLSRPRPEFVVYTTPSAVTLPAGCASPIWMRALRKDGYDGPIDVRLAEGPEGAFLDGGLFQPGETEILCTLTLPAVSGAREPETLFPLRFEAFAEQDGRTVRRPVEAAEDMEQAFLYHHWVPARNFLAYSNASRPGFGFRPVEPKLLQLKPGESVDVAFVSNAPSVPGTAICYLQGITSVATPPHQVHPPAGIWIKRKSQEGNTLVLTVGVDKDALQKITEKERQRLNPPTQAGEKKEAVPKATAEPEETFAGNLIIAIDMETVPKNKNDKKTRYPTGLLPALPIRIAK